MAIRQNTDVESTAAVDQSVVRTPPPIEQSKLRDFVGTSTSGGEDGSLVNSTNEETDESESEGCPECGGRVVEDGHERVCEGCGLVVGEDMIDHGPEWRNFENTTSDPCRAKRIDRTKHDNGMGTGGFSPGLNASLKERRMSRVQKWGKDTRERNLRSSLGDLKLAVSQLEVSDTVESIGANLFKQFYGDEAHTGHDLDQMVAATVYAACRLCDAGITPDEVAAQLDVDRRGLYSELQRLKKAVDTPIPVEEPTDYIPRFVTELDGSARVETAARNLAAEVNDTDLLIGCKPSGIAAAVVYITFRDHSDVELRSQIEIGEVTGVSAKTIRSNYNTIESEIPISSVAGFDTDTDTETEAGANTMEMAV